MSSSRWQGADKVMVALDFPAAAEARQLLRQLEGIPCYMKVGMELFYAAGPAFVEQLKEQGYKVFLDLKLHDIPNTVKGGARSVARLGVDMFNVHAAGGLQMMVAALEGAAEGAKLGGMPGEGPQVIAVTQLTSTSRQMLNEQIGIDGPVEAAVVRYASLAKQAGLHGVVASPLEVKQVKAACGEGFLAVTPGIRPAETAQDDQQRVMTPRQALTAGSDYMVIGRPITQSDDPRDTLIQILKELNIHE